jgi:hypothetical protein
MVMITFRVAATPTLEQVKQRFGLKDDEVDAAFGVIEIDPDTHDHAIRVAEAAAARITSQPGWSGEGPFSDPKIAPFGPPQR